MFKFFQNISLHTTLFLWFLLFLVSSPLASEVPIVLSAELKPYFDFVEGFQEVFPQTKVFLLPANERDLIRRMKKKYPSVAVAVGSKALAILDRVAPPSTRIFYGLVVSPEDAASLAKRHSRCGLYLRLPPEQTFSCLREALIRYLDLKEPLTMIVPYSSPAVEPFVEKMKVEGIFHDFEVLSMKVTDVSDLRNFLLKSWRKFQILYFVPDPLFSFEAVIKLLLKEALLHYKITCGYNRFFYREGAFISFVFDYRKVGREAARKVDRLLREGHCQEEPAPFEVLINKKVLKFLYERQLKKNVAGEI